MSEPRQPDNERHTGAGIENPRIDSVKEMVANIREHLATTGPFTWGNMIVDPPGPDASGTEQEVDRGLEM